MGVIGDLAFGGILGEQALRLVVMVFILQRFRAQVRFFPMAQQALVIGGLLLNDRVVTAAVHLMLDEPQLPWSYWWAPLLGMVLWVPLFVLLDALRFGRRKASTGACLHAPDATPAERSEEHTSELQSLMRTTDAVFCLKKKKQR